jgi:hypothetical protein
MSERDGPMGLACQEIRNAIDEFADPAVRR